MKKKKKNIINHKCEQFWSNSYIEYEINSDKNEALLVEEYLYKMRPYLKGIMNNLRKSDTWNNSVNNSK